MKWRASRLESFLADTPGRDGLLEAVELDQDGALGDSGVMRHDPTATDEGPTAPGLHGRTGQLVVSSQLLRV